MKKTTIALAALLSSAIAVPAHANDAVRIGVGILGLVINEATKGNKGGNQRRPRNGDELIGRVGEQPSRNNRARSGNKVAPAVAAGGAAVAALVLPEGDQIPLPIAKPTEQEMAEYAALQAASPSTPETDTEEGVPLYDEQGRFWGSVTPADAQKVEQAVALGMKPSTVIPDMLGLKLPEAKPQSMEVPLVASIETTPQQSAEFEADLNAAVAAEGGQLQKAAEVAIPEKEVEAAEVVPALPLQTTTETETVATPAVVDTTATTASVTAEPKVDLAPAKPVEAVKPKKKLDL
ncbi:hypothetical protein [Agrobacterium pusense]|uniref:hypothetical protein n=1 Tax=Agrobacterium pusense TaxID=648995 RepID=UPI000D380A02|nr:hypothetical protein [Agrobacterium pusense]PTV70188.1 hypothetical protein DBL06_25325 [Agrobacterium pusense]